MTIEEILTVIRDEYGEVAITAVNGQAFDEILDQLREKIAELESARKVADAAERWLDCRNNGNDEAEDVSWAALHDAVREYRKGEDKT